MIKIKRIYEEPEPQDGYRVLVDRLWPRGLSKEKTHLDSWLKEIAPSDELRHWFSHDPAKWGEFRKRYQAELAAMQPLLDELRGQAKKGTLTLLYAAKDDQHNNAVVLKDVLESGK
jgi:uncharacterized protein YeaO (DUF488 family)